ncbi:MAG: hypothetical protein RR311_06440 [Comamonas sp.]
MAVLYGVAKWKAESGFPVRGQSLETAPARRQTGIALHRMAAPVLLLSFVYAWVIR